MATFSELLDKVENFEIMSQQQKVKIVAFIFTVINNANSFGVNDIKASFLNEGLKEPSNIHRELINLTSCKPAIFLKRNDDYIFERHAKMKLEEAYFNEIRVKQVSSILRLILENVQSPQKRVFLEECINCYEIGAYRSSVVMSWLLAIATISEFVLKLKLNEFNAAIQSHGKYKKLSVTNKDDFTEIKESDFIELLRVAKIITNDTRKILDEKLSFRNTCAHPNSIIVKDSKAVAFIEDVIENIITKYSS